MGSCMLSKHFVVLDSPSTSWFIAAGNRNFVVAIEPKICSKQEQITCEDEMQVFYSAFTVNKYCGGQEKNFLLEKMYIDKMLEPKNYVVSESHYRSHWLKFASFNVIMKIIQC